MEQEFTYKCENCGECCKNGNPARWDPKLDDGNGNCPYLDLTTNLCTIYETRFDFCRIHSWYEKNYAPKGISKDLYLQSQIAGCDYLRRLAGKEE